MRVDQAIVVFLRENAVIWHRRFGAPKPAVVMLWRHLFMKAYVQSLLCLGCLESYRGKESIALCVRESGWCVRESNRIESQMDKRGRVDRV